MQLDELDSSILRLLQEDGRLSYRQLAEKTGSTTPTVSTRVRALEQLGIIRGFHAEVDSQVLGGTHYVITIRARPAAVGELTKKVLKMPGVQDVALLAGGTLSIRARFFPPTATLEAMHDAVAALDDVISYDALQVLTLHRPALAPLTLQEAKVACHFCKGPIHEEPVRGTFGEKIHVFCCRHCLSSFRERFEKLERRRSKQS